MHRSTLHLIALFSVVVAACREQADPTPPSSVAPTASVRVGSPLTRVGSPSTVCMVNDRYMGAEQIPVVVEGRTYYGCCAGCKEKLQNQVDVRTARDPVTRNTVDKATAVIARTETGKVLYFESADTLARF